MRRPHPVLLALLTLAALVPGDRVRAATQAIPSFRATSVLSGGGDIVNAVSHWTFVGPGHFRLDNQITAPLLKRGTETIAANGAGIVWYRSIYGRAWRLPIPHAGLSAMAMFAAGSNVSVIDGMGQDYLTYIRHHGGKVHILRQVTLLGRPAEVIAVRPLYSGSGSQPYGRAVFWLDRDYGFVLRFQTFGLSGHGAESNDFLFRVTSLTFDPTLTARDASYTPSVTPVAPPRAASSSSGGSSGGTGVNWHPSSPFLAVRTPAGLTLVGSGEAQDSVWSGISSVFATFRGAAGSLRIEQQIRVTGLPAQLRKGPSRPAGACSVWMGTFGNGERWLALQRGTVSLLVTSATLPTPTLRQFVAHDICL